MYDSSQDVEGGSKFAFLILTKNDMRTILVISNNIECLLSLGCWDNLMLFDFVCNIEQTYSGKPSIYIQNVT